MRTLYIEGLAIHGGPESCVGVPRGRSEALTGVRAGSAIEPRNVILVRFADDYIAGFEHRDDAERFLADLRERFAKFALELHPEKTRLIEFGRFAAELRQRRGLRKPET